MRLPDQDSSTAKHLGFARYTKRHCAVAGFADLAADVDGVTVTLVATDRALQDSEGPLQDALAGRDIADADLDEAVRTIRQGLANRSLTSIHETPYTDVFHSGIEYYTRAPLGQEVTRLTDLCDRLALYLPVEDPARAEGVPEVQRLLAGWTAARDEVEAARRAQGVARTARENALAAWEDTLTKNYGALIVRIGKKKAERCFQRIRRSAKPKTPAVVTTDEGASG